VNAPPDPYEQTRAGFDHQMAAIKGYDIRERLKDIRVPTLVISSPDDMLVPPRFQEELVAGIPGAEIKRYPGGHIFMVLPMYAPQFIADVTAFWKAHE
jgi:pimeloyl-ACP methyl ester carboxylesterase